MKDGGGVVVGCGEDTRNKSEEAEEGGGGSLPVFTLWPLDPLWIPLLLPILSRSWQGRLSSSPEWVQGTPREGKGENKTVPLIITFSGHLSPNKLSVKIMTQLKISIFLLPTQGERFCVPEGSLHTEKTLAERKAARSFSSVI